MQGAREELSNRQSCPDRRPCPASRIHDIKPRLLCAPSEASLDSSAEELGASFLTLPHSLVPWPSQRGEPPISFIKILLLLNAVKSWALFLATKNFNTVKHVLKSKTNKSGVLVCSMQVIH